MPPEWVPKKSRELFNWLQMRCNKEAKVDCENVEDCVTCRYATYSRLNW